MTPRVKGIWKCKGAESGTVFSDVDMTEGEWTDYDEKVDKPYFISCDKPISHNHLGISTSRGYGFRERMVEGSLKKPNLLQSKPSLLYYIRCT